MDELIGHKVDVVSDSHQPGVVLFSGTLEAIDKTDLWSVKIDGEWMWLADEGDSYKIVKHGG